MTKKKTTTRKASRALAAVADELAALDDMSVKELQQRYEELHGKSSRSRNRAYLLKRVAFKIQEDAEGGLSDKAKARIDELAADAKPRVRRAKKREQGEGAPSRKEPATPKRSMVKLATPVAAMKAKDADSDAKAPKPRDPRLPDVGATIEREHDGKKHRVKVMDTGFEYEGERYRSLSAIAKVITGTTWNGWLFFGLAARAKKEAKA